MRDAQLPLGSSLSAVPLASVTDKFEMVEPLDPWRGRQPKYEKLVMRDLNHFFLKTKLPWGRPIAVQLGRLPREMPLPPGPK
jgi:hypothetical protein